MTALLKAAIEQLQVIKSQRKDQLQKMSDAKNAALTRFQPLFDLKTIGSLKAEDFKDFLVNNGHWSGLARGTYKRASADMALLHDGLRILLNEDEDIAKRLNALRPHGKEVKVPGLGRAVLSAILQITHPDKYGVWNKTSESAMKALGIWPLLSGKDGFGEQYRKMNDVLLELVAPSNGLGLDLWTLDSAWWGVLKEEPPPATDETRDDEAKPGFGLEKYLREFLADNWEQTTLGKDNWSLYQQDDEVVGVEYDTNAVGRIDILACQKDKWLVVELKKGQSSDQAVGQVLRYMGWVAENLAQNQVVYGLIIARSADERLRLALKHTCNVSVLLYEVDFHLKKVFETI